ncbi:MAG TPA: FAD-dependent oxidoreductase, partial [Chryseosolibacter sp.]
MNYDVIIIGGGQSGLATGYYLRRTGLSFLILDNQKTGGGAWLHTWKSLRLFSPAQWSSLPGMIMAGGTDYYPTKDETISYLQAYESKYNLPVKRGVSVWDVTKVDEEFQLQTSDGVYIAKAVVSATGSFYQPFIPEFPGADVFKGLLIHSSQ